MTETATVKGTVRHEIKARLAEIARNQGKASEDELVAEVLENYVAAYDQEARLIQEALDEAHAGGPLISGEDMEAWAKSLGSDRPLPPPEPDALY